MLFSSVEFIFYFLPAVAVVFFALARLGGRYSALAWLVAASLFFYSVWNPPYLALLLASITGNYGFGRVLSHRPSKFLLGSAICFNLGLIAYFKYANFFIDNAGLLFGTNLPAAGIVLPLAISFFTFQQIAYLVDVYQGKVRDPDFIHYALFVSFFPQLISGPIVHHSEVIPQFSEKKRLQPHWENLGAGLAIFIIGLQKKVVLADGIAPYADAVFDGAALAAPSFFPAWIGALAYTFQLYFDFSGYSDMAIGLARMFGIVLPLNFDSPYKAVNIVDFWRRWHMTLARFLKDYLYVPLGGNRKGQPQRYINLMITMLLGGRWHGASWTFVFWGGLHGVYLVVNHGWRAVRRRMGHDLSRSTSLGRGFSRLVTLLAVVVGWVFFRADDWHIAAAILESMAGLNGVVLPEAYAGKLGSMAFVLGDLGVKFAGTPFQGVVVFWLAGLLALVLFFPNTQEWVEQSAAVPSVLRARMRVWAPPFIGATAAVLLLIVIAKGAETNDFIYMIF